MNLVEEKQMSLNAGDGLVVFGGGSISISSFINLYTVNEWIVVGILVGIFCSIVGCMAGILIRCMWLKARINILKDVVKYKNSQLNEMSTTKSVPFDHDGV